MIRKLLVGAAGAIASDFLTDNASVRAQIEKTFTDLKSQDRAYAVINGLGAVLAVKYFGG